MSFALYPDGGLPRLWRFIDPETFDPEGITFGWPAADVVSVLNAEANLLYINKPLFDKMPELHQISVLRTHARYERYTAPRPLPPTSTTPTIHTTGEATNASARFASSRYR